MPELPLLRLPNPDPIGLPPGPRMISRFRFPSKRRQAERFGPVFERLQSFIARAETLTELRDDPSSLAPERVIVFEIAGTVTNFLNALRKVNGLEFMAEYDTEAIADEDFAVQDQQDDRSLLDRVDKPVPGRFYLAMPDIQALTQLRSLWDRWKNDQPMDRGFTPFRDLFAQLRDIRPWGLQDRIPQETIDFWREESARKPDRPVRTEIELWYRDSEAKRRAASASIRAAMAESGGEVIHEAVVADIAYHGMLVDVPSGYVQDLIEHRAVRLAVADEVMFLRPQSVLNDPLENETSPDTSLEAPVTLPSRGEPIVALLDGVPIQSHLLLVDRLIIDDPDDLQSKALTRPMKVRTVNSITLMLKEAPTGLLRIRRCIPPLRRIDHESSSLAHCRCRRRFGRLFCFESTWSAVCDRL
jgi:hypothetical protein